MTDNFNLIHVIQDYFERILQDVAGIKSLILDQDTTAIISLISSQSQILKKDVYLIEKIESNSKDKLTHLKAIYILRPTAKNFIALQNEIKDPRYSEYYLYFTNQIPDTEIQKLAETDEKDMIKQIQEVYFDYQAINKDFFSLGVDSTISLTKSQSQWITSDIQNLKQIVDGLFATCLSLRKCPVIRFLGKSDACTQIAEELTKKLQKELSGNQGQFDKDKKCVLLLTDRREDPVTPLLNQWTYQAMLHELFGIDQNVLDLSKTNKKLAEKKIEEREFVISAIQDAFFEKNIYSNFGELATNIKDYIDEMSNARQKSVKIESLDDMQRALDALPELKQMSGNVQKHVTLTTEVSRLVDERTIMEVSRVEQELACKDNKNEHYKIVKELLNNKQIHTFDKLKLVILYQLRYETDERVAQFKDKLKSLGVGQSSISIIDNVISYAGKHQRAGDLFGNKDLFSMTKNMLNQALKEVPNVYTQHVPYIMNLIDQLEKGKLKESDYPQSSYERYDRYDQTMVFVLGGATFEEAMQIGIKNQQKGTLKYMLGGSTVHNSKTFLADVSQLNMTTIDLDQSMGLQAKKNGFYQMN